MAMNFKHSKIKVIYVSDVNTLWILVDTHPRSIRIVYFILENILLDTCQIL